MDGGLRHERVASRGTIAAGLGVVLLAASLSACSAAAPGSTSAGGEATAAAVSATATTSPSPTGTASASSGATATPSASGTATSTNAQKSGGSQAQAAPTRRPDGMPGDRSVGKVRRPGTPGASTAPQEPQPPTALAPAALSGRVAYRDGTAVRIVRMERGAQTAQGPGAFPGSGFVAVDLEVSAGSRPLDLSRVVVTALAGDPQVVVGPVYVPEAKTRDFTGRLAASPAGAAAKATARYAFAVPTQATQLRLVVDLDDAHGNAVFAGPLA